MAFSLGRFPTVRSTDIEYQAPSGSGLALAGVFLIVCLDGFFLFISFLSFLSPSMYYDCDGCFFQATGYTIWIYDINLNLPHCGSESL
ncbi:hypothetical protein BDV11DRAFT_108265 [Aspergillus similis]